MNPLISPTSSLFLPLTQLTPHCNRLLNSLNNDRANQKERILYEQTLWNEVKKIRTLNDQSIFLYLIGYYHTILYRIAKLSTQSDLFQYHVLIRLGDLNRYMEKTDVAEYYYCNARNLFPFFGHAYNQIGLLIKPINCYKCCYFYARAARSSDKPLNTIADSNLRIAVSKYNCEILNHILNNEACKNIDDDSLSKLENLPESAFEWFYLIVIAIYADNIQPISKLFLSYLNENFSTQKAITTQNGVKIVDIYCDRKSYVLLASLDIFLDWLKIGSQGKAIISAIRSELCQIRACLQSIITSFYRDPLWPNNNNRDATPISMDSSKTSSNFNSTSQDSSHLSATESSKSSSFNKVPALPHDYVLRGFRPLDCMHRDLNFKMEVHAKGTIEDSSIGDKLNCQKFIDTGQLMQILTRIKSKLDSSGPFVRRQTRNIALESILSNMGKDKNDL